MLTAYVRALGQLFDPRIVRLIGFSVFLSLAVFVGLWTGLAWLLSSQTIAEWGVVKSIVDWLGSAAATVVLALFLFPAVVSSTIGLLLDAVARAVEARHYPGLPPAKGVGFVAGLVATLRFLLKALLVNVLLLLFLLVPAVYPFVWLLAHAYLLGREYFELVAMRRLDVRTARELRRSNGVSVLFGGAVAVPLFAVPVVNLLAPVLVTMAMVHACERWRPTPRA